MKVACLTQAIWCLKALNFFWSLYGLLASDLEIVEFEHPQNSDGNDIHSVSGCVFEVWELLDFETVNLHYAMAQHDFHEKCCLSYDWKDSADSIFSFRDQTINGFCILISVTSGAIKIVFEEKYAKAVSVLLYLDLK